jgi:hypothetical protein
VAAALQGRSEIGDGDIHRAVMTAQKRHWGAIRENLQ